MISGKERKIKERLDTEIQRNDWSGFIFQSWYELKSLDPYHLEMGLKLYEKSSEIIDKELGE